MRRFLLSFCLSVICIAAASAADFSSADLRVLDPATVATPKGMTSTAMYVTVDNPALESDELIAVRSPFAKMAELNGSRMDGGKIQTYPVGTVLIMPGGTTRLGPGSWHIKLMDIKRPLEVGDEVPLTLTFARAGDRTVTVQVLEPDVFVKTYPLDTMLLTVRKLQADGARGAMPAILP